MICQEAPLYIVYVYALAIAFILSLGWFILLSGWKSVANRLFFFISATTALWLFFNVMSWIRPEELIWSQFGVVGVVVPAIFVCFLLFFPDEKVVISPRKVLLVGVPLLPVILLAGTSLVYSGIDFSDPGCPAVPGDLISFYVPIIVVGYILAAANIAVRKWRASQDMGIRRSIRLLLFGFILPVLWSLITTVIGPKLGYDVLSMYASLGVLVLIGAVGLAIIKYQFLSINVILTQLFTVILWIIISLEFTFTDTPIQRVFVGLTLLLAVIFGVMLMRSARRDHERKKELQEMADRLAFANQELRRLDNAKSEFISIASHQLRTPLTAIKGYVSLMLEGTYGKISNEVEDVMNKVYAANGRLIELVDNLLNISRIESGRMQYSFQPEDLVEIIDDLHDTFAVIAKKKGIGLSFVVPEHPLPKVSLDRMKIREIISNMIDNAIKYTEKGSVTVSVYLGDKDKVRVAVKDSGIGVRPEDKDRLFSKFTRSKDTERMHVGGTGLGLYVGRTFAERHGGRLYVESDGAGKGSEFILELPLEPPRPKELPAA